MSIVVQEQLQTSLSLFSLLLHIYDQSRDRCDILIIFVSIFVINTFQHDDSRLNAFTRLKVLEALIALHFLKH